MKNNDERTALRLPSKMRRQMEELIAEGRYRNLSQVVRIALEDFLKHGGIEVAAE